MDGVGKMSIKSCFMDALADAAQCQLSNVRAATLNGHIPSNSRALGVVWVDVERSPAHTGSVPFAESSLGLCIEKAAYLGELIEVIIHQGLCLCLAELKSSG